MDTAPQPGAPVTMPDPARVVTQSVYVLRRKGVPTSDALAAICVAARKAMISLQEVGIRDTGWLDGIWINARQRWRAMQPPDATTKGDGSGSNPSTGPGTGSH